MARYRFVDYATQTYLLGMGLLIVLFHNERTPQWAPLLGMHVLGVAAVHGLVVGHGRRPGSRLLRLGRHFYPMVTFVVLYCEACALDLMFHERYLDSMAIRAEEWLFGCQPWVVWMERLPWLAVSEVFYLAYASLYVMVLGLGIALYVKDRSELLHYLALASFVFYACYVFFIILPVAGPPIYWNGPPGLAAWHGLPRLAVAFPASVQRGPFFQFIAFVYARFGIQGGGFPSSHIAVAVCTLCFTWRCFPRMRHAHLVAVVLLCLATVYCRCHYAVDMLGGLAAAALLIPLGEILYRRLEGACPPPHPPQGCRSSSGPCR